MPLPEPKKEERLREFVSRCMSNKQAIKEFPERDQRTGYCYNAYREAKKK